MSDSKDSVERVIYCFWTDDNPITPTRLKGLESMRENIGVHIEFLDKKGIAERILPQKPLHPGYKYLSCNHKSDYLRCYFMHHFGGGYADIKPYSRNNNWSQCFDYINRYSEIELIGQHDFRGGIAIPELRTNENAEYIVACGFMICRAHTLFTSTWMQQVEKAMDSYLFRLRKTPASEPFGGAGYPIEWAGLCGKIFHKIQYDAFKSRPNAIRNCLRTGWLGFGTPYR